jgi:hypothetical protein
MADLSDVEAAIVAEVIGALYPDGIAQNSIVGVPCRIYRGWPSPAGLNTDLAAGTVNVTVFPATAPDEVPDPYLDTFYTSGTPSSLAANVTGQSVILSGTVAINQTVGILVDGAAFTYGTIQGDTTDSIAANLAALVRGVRSVSLTGSSFFIPGAISLVARVVVNASVSWGLRRQRRDIQVNCWCPSPMLRDSVGKAIDLALASQPFINLADGTRTHVRYVSTQVFDQSQNALLYRRDFCYKCEYTIIGSTVAPVMLFGDLINNGNSSFV